MGNNFIPPSPSTNEPDASRVQAALPYLTKLSHGSSAFIATFLLIHLSAPVLANVGGSSLSSQVMLLGREYYQTSFGEKYLVLAPLAVHSLSGLAKRLLSPKPPRPLSNLLAIAGYASLCVFVPIHFLTHRVNPTVTTPPIYAVGPSELDYEFVKVGLHRWPGQSWLLYVGLVSLVALHAIQGANIIWNGWLRDSLGSIKKWKRNNVIAAAGGIVAPILSGLYIISKERLTTSPWTIFRFRAVFEQTWLYRL